MCIHTYVYTYIHIHTNILWHANTHVLSGGIITSTPKQTNYMCEKEADCLSHFNVRIYLISCIVIWDSTLCF